MMAVLAILCLAALLGGLRLAWFLRATRAGAYADPIGATFATWLSRGGPRR